MVSELNELLALAPTVSKELSEELPPPLVPAAQQLADQCGRVLTELVASKKVRSPTQANPDPDPNPNSSPNPPNP